MSRSRFALALLPVLCLSACGSGDDADVVADDAVVAEEPADVMRASAYLQPTTAPGAEAAGIVTFEQRGDSVVVMADLSGLAPGSRHGFHVHENGSCDEAEVDGTMTPAGAAGGHFDPMTAPHGAPSNALDARHVGDLGNVTADADGQVQLTMADVGIALSGASSIVGKALVLHAEADDLTSQPSGAAGARIGCGIITLEEG